MIKELSKDKVNDESDEEEAFAMRVFDQFNLKKENTNSYTILVENNRADEWDNTFTSLYGKSQIPNMNESNGRH